LDFNQHTRNPSISAICAPICVIRGKQGDQMAHSKSTRDTALQLFIQGTPIEKIAAEMKIPLKTVYNWKARHDWNSFLRVGNLEIAATSKQSSTNSSRR
jgi:hypothetical protein